MPNNRAKTIAEYRFPPDWTPIENQRWLEAAKKMQAAKDEYKTTVLVTGVFDLLHEEHVRFLQKARAVGNFLLVGIESDARVRELKGPDRPEEPAEVRRTKVLETELVDEAFILPEAFNQPEHHRALLALIRPHILAVSSHSPYLEAKRNLMALFGGELRVVHEHNPQVSTTQLLKHRTINES